MSRMIAFVCTALSAFRPTHELWQRRSAYKSRVDERQFTTFAAARKPPIMIVTEVYGSPARKPGYPRFAQGRGCLGRIGKRSGQYRCTGWCLPLLLTASASRREISLRG